VSIGLLDHELNAIAGAVVAPCVQLEWMGAIDSGAFRNGERCEVSPIDSLDQALVGTGFPTQRDVAPDNNFDAFFRVKRAAGAVRRCGSAAMDVCMVADGTYDAYWERKVHPWDLAAGAAIALAAGARVTALDGSRANLRVGHVLVSNGRIHEELLPLVR
jgi:myo-inositol-1(or 4)-monophosphatase